MKKNPILARPQHTARLGMSPKNMTHTLKFTSSVGQLLPVYYDWLNPGEKVRISDVLFTRTQTLFTSALVSLTEHIEYFFVPAHLLNSKFPDFITGVHSTPFTTVLSGIDADSGCLLGMTITPQIAQFFDQPHGLDTKTGDVLIYTQDRLLQHLGYGQDFFKKIADGDVSTDDAVYINTLRLQAYQKICQDYYWREDWDKHNMRAFNNDFGDYLTNNDLLALTELHTCPWKKDYFTLAIPQPIFNAQSVNAFSGTIQGSENQFLLSPYVIGQSDADFDSVSYPSGYTNFQSSQSTFRRVTTGDTTLSPETREKNVEAFASYPQATPNNTQSIRLNLALEKLYTITNYAKKDYVSQIAAHFGYHANNYLSYRSIKIASHSSPLDINQVVSTAGTTEATLGQVSGYGVGGSKSSKSDFVAPCHGIFMAIYHCYPEADYSNDGVDEFVFRKNRIDFYTPEMDNLGLVPQNPIVGNLTNDPQAWTGYTFRYLEEKLKYNKIITGFNTPEFTPWVISRSSMAIATGVSDLYVQPDYLDPIMLQKYYGSFQGSKVDGHPLWSNYVRDPLFHVIRFNIVKLSTHSTYGLPKL